MTSSRAALRRLLAELRWSRVWEDSPDSLDPVTPSEPEVTLCDPAAENRAKARSKAVPRSQPTAPSSRPPKATCTTHKPETEKNVNAYDLSACVQMSPIPPPAFDSGGVAAHPARNRTMHLA
jgi:hypothetical protein